MKSLGRILGRKDKGSRENQILDIGLPTDVKKGISVHKNPATGDLEGLPKAWYKLLKSQITEKEEIENPSAGKWCEDVKRMKSKTNCVVVFEMTWFGPAYYSSIWITLECLIINLILSAFIYSRYSAYQAVKYYNYSIKKKDNIEPFKPLITEKAIVEESNEIEEFLFNRNAHNSEDSFTTDSSEENIPTTESEIPPELPPPLPKKSATLPPMQKKPAILPKPPMYQNLKPKTKPKPSSLQKPMHQAMGDLRLIDDKEGGEVNDNNIDNQPKSTIVTKSPEFTTLMPDESNNNNNTFIDHDNDSTTVDEDETAIMRPKKPTRVTKSDEEVYAELKNICNMSNPLNKYSKVKEVGKGASGVVFIALDLETQKQVAIKTIDLKNQSSKELILNEIRVLSDFNHKNLVNFLEAYFLEESDTLWVILEYMNGWVVVDA